MSKDNLFARAIQAARREQRISQRELARRSGVSPSQISRIESGAITTPAYWTVDAIAQALGKPGDLLGILGHDSILEEHVPYLQELEGIDFEIVPGQLTEEQHQTVRNALYQAVLGASIFDEFTGSGNDRLIERVVSCWPGLTDKRREAVAAFVDDQLTLSELERRHDANKEVVA